jgi:hypothetical protein
MRVTQRVDASTSAQSRANRTEIHDHAMTTAKLNAIVAAVVEGVQSFSPIPESNVGIHVPLRA